MWTDISDRYEASDDGHIRNKKTKRILREYVGKDGYLRTQFDGKTTTVHRAIATAFIPRVPNKHFINHKDGDKTNNQANNLEWCTRSENMKHAYEHQLKSSLGVKNGRCKLTGEQVNFIKATYLPGDDDFGAKALSKKFGVAPQTISAVACGQNWKTQEERKR